MVKASWRSPALDPQVSLGFNREITLKRKKLPRCANTHRSGRLRRLFVCRKAFVAARLPELGTSHAIAARPLVGAGAERSRSSLIAWRRSAECCHTTKVRFLAASLNDIDASETPATMAFLQLCPCSCVLSALYVSRIVSRKDAKTQRREAEQLDAAAQGRGRVRKSRRIYGARAGRSLNVTVTEFNNGAVSASGLSRKSRMH